ncbi:hypothetical protein ACFWIA_26760 [Streptomyces sp. NPDC127068]|uniref:hypothetical protein n=1 Tax=Streptomyces sp. NPDC127068 TaxID=3347127 RepID=UPI0036681663
MSRRALPYCDRCERPIRWWQRCTRRLRFSPSGPGSTLHLHRRCAPEPVPCAPCLKAKIFGSAAHGCHGTSWYRFDTRTGSPGRALRLRVWEGPAECPCACRTRAVPTRLTGG